MNVVDLVVFAVVLLNAVAGAFRGFARQSLKIAGGIVALWTALNFHDRASAFLQDRFDALKSWGPTALAALGFLAVGLAVYLAASILAHLARAGMEKARMGGADRFLGFLLGAAKGALLTAVALHFLSPVATRDFAPDKLKEYVFGGPDGNPPPSRAYELYDRYVRDAAVRAEREAAETVKKPR